MSKESPAKSALDAIPAKMRVTDRLWRMLEMTPKPFIPEDGRDDKCLELKRAIYRLLKSSTVDAVDFFHDCLRIGRRCIVGREESALSG